MKHEHTYKCDKQKDAILISLLLYCLEVAHVYCVVLLRQKQSSARRRHPEELAAAATEVHLCRADRRVRHRPLQRVPQRTGRPGPRALHLVLHSHGRVIQPIIQKNEDVLFFYQLFRPPTKDTFDIHLYLFHFWRFFFFFFSYHRPFNSIVSGWAAILDSSLA